MFLFKCSLFLFALFGSAATDPDGWIAVERPAAMPPVEGADERDPSIWVVFSKKIGSERLLVRFPEEPTYRHWDADGEQIEILSASAGVEHRLQVVPNSSRTAAELLQARREQLHGAVLISASTNEEKERADLLYLKDGLWHLEHLIATKAHSYFLQTRASEMEAAAHHTFVQSFSIDFDRKCAILKPL